VCDGEEFGGEGEGTALAERIGRMVVALIVA